MEQKNLSAEKRTTTGKNENNRLRKAGFIPAILYAHGKAESLQVQKKEFNKIFKGHISESVILNVNIAGGASELAFIKDFQKEPVTGEITHLDLYKVFKDEKIHTKVEIHLTGVAKGIKMGGVLEIYDRFLEIECFPMDLPEKIEVDVTNLELNDTIHAEDLKLSDKIKILAAPKTMIAAVHEPKTVEETAEVETAAAPAAEAVKEAEDKK